ncbi:hypothetical protein ACFY9A_10565 [Streptomyces rubradiris]|uniref:hypothetical protein n=1 Tax=Streptomyces rubradiris TaxID=285531 RepID=UPI0036EE5715
MSLLNPTTSVPVPLWLWLLAVVIVTPPAFAWWRHKFRLAVVFSATVGRAAKHKARQWLRHQLERIMQDAPGDQ